MAKPDYNRVLRMVAAVLKNNAIAYPPVSPREIAESYGIEVIEVEFDKGAKDVAGFFDFEESAIYLNMADPYSRKTFTIAHELGHHLLHQEHFDRHRNEYVVLMRRPVQSAKEPLEKEANAFAANLLVPRKFLDKYVGYASVTDLANIFAVSKDVIRARLQFEYGTDPEPGQGGDRQVVEGAGRPR